LGVHLLNQLRAFLRTLDLRTVFVDIVVDRLLEFRQALPNGLTCVTDYHRLQRLPQVREIVVDRPELVQGVQQVVVLLGNALVNLDKTCHRSEPFCVSLGGCERLLGVCRDELVDRVTSSIDKLVALLHYIAHVALETRGAGLERVRRITLETAVQLLRLVVIIAQAFGNTVNRVLYILDALLRFLGAELETAGTAHYISPSRLGRSMWMCGFQRAFSRWHAPVT
jgi:hypothetical protein